MVIDWFRFLLRQFATALVAVTSMLLFSEILLPASVLPYFNLHILVLVTLILAAASPILEKKSRLRFIILVPLVVLLLAYAWLMFGTSTSGLALFAALGIGLVGVVVALASDPPPLNPPQNEEGKARGGGSLVVEETVEIEIIEAETSVFMR